MKKEEYKKNNIRISYSKEFKRKVLIELSKGKKNAKIFDDLFENDFEVSSSDKKYFSKLINKWKKQVYENPKYFAFNNIKLTNELLQYEIENIGKDEEEDEIYKEFLIKKSQNQDKGT